MLLIRVAEELVRAMPVLFGLLIAGRGNGGAVWGLVATGLLVGHGILRWFTTAYRITPEQIQLRHGVLRRRVLTVPRDRVRTVDATSHALHRVLGLTRLTIGTGRSDRKDSALRLDALRAPEAAQLRDELLHRRGTTAPPPAAAAVSAGTARTAAPASMLDGTELARLRPAWFAYGPFTLSGVVTVGVLAAFSSRIGSEVHIDPQRSGALRGLAHAIDATPLPVVILLALLATLLLVTIASTLGYLLAFWSFRLTRTAGGTLHVTRGLITTRATTIEERRLRGVELSEPLGLRAVGGARCIAIATGLRVGRGAERGGSPLLPPAPRAEAERVAAAVLGRDEPLRLALRSHGPVARRRRFVRALTAAAPAPVVLVALSQLAGPTELALWAALAALVLLPAAALLAEGRVRSLGHCVDAGLLVTQRGWLVRRRCMLQTDGIVGWTLRRSLFQRRGDVATLSATTAAGRQRYELQDVELAEALRVAEAATPGLLAPFLVPR
jgi:putative membrane protein